MEKAMRKVGDGELEVLILGSEAKEIKGVTVKMEYALRDMDGYTIFNNVVPPRTFFDWYIAISKDGHSFEFSVKCERLVENGEWVADCNIKDAFADGMRYLAYHAQRLYSFSELFPTFDSYMDDLRKSFSFDDSDWFLEEDEMPYNNDYETSLWIRNIIDRDWIVALSETYVA